MNSMTGSLYLCLVLSSSGTPTLLCVLLNCFLNSETLASQVGIDSSSKRGGGTKEKTLEGEVVYWLERVRKQFSKVVYWLSSFLQCLRDLTSLLSNLARSELPESVCK